MSIPVFRKLVDRPMPGPVMRYFYITEVARKIWAVDLDADVAEGRQRFVWDDYADDPPGRDLGMSGARGINELFDGAVQIGHIDDDGELRITTHWVVPESWHFDGTPMTWTAVPKDEDDEYEGDLDDDGYIGLNEDEA